MKDLTCEKCGRTVDESTVFCPNCGAAVFHTFTPAPSAPPAPEPAPVEVPPEKAPEKFDFKKLIPPAAVILAVMLALIFSWDTLAGIFAPGKDPQLSTQPSTEQTYPITVLPTETTVPTEILVLPTLPPPTETEPVPTEPDLSWYVENLKYMSYQDFFSVKRTSSGPIAQESRVWTIGGKEFALIHNQDFQIYLNGESIYTVPGSNAVASGHTTICTDGRYAYLHNSTQLLRLDLLTGVTDILFTFDEIIQLDQPFREMCYIAAEMNGTISLCRLYLPTATLDVLYDGIPARTPRSWLTIHFPSSTHGTISWQGISPEMVDALYAEFSNPGSIYYPNFGDTYSDLSEFWEDPEQMRWRYGNGYAAQPMIKLQDDKNLQALWKGTYNIADGTVTQDWGVVDTCWFGSGYPHDHWNPELTADIPPAILNVEAIPVPGMVSPSEEMAEAIRQEGYDDQNKLYKADGPYGYTKAVQIYQNGEYQTASHLPHVSASNYLLNCKYYSYYASVDNTLIRLDLSGTASVIYTAKHGDLRETCYHGGNLYFLDGDTLVMLDTIACTSRELLQHPGSIWMYYDTDEQKIYMDTVLGMTINAYLFDPITGTLEETSYRL